MKKIPNRKLYIISIIIAIITIAYSLYIKETEGPNINLQEQAKEETKSNTIQTPEEKILTNENTTKYKIINRSVVAPIDITNKEKVILLTVDDGPSSRTKDMISILEKHNAKAIFFVNGMHNKNYPGVIEYIAQEGFSVGNHTWDHLNLKKETNTDTIESEINRNGDLIEKLTGIKPKFFRAPYGESNTYIRNLVKEDGMILIDWSGSALDWEKSTVEKDVFIGNVMNNLHSGSIILIHEHPWSLANLDALLTTLEEKGYTYVDPNNIIE